MHATPPSRGKTPGIDHYENFPVASWLCPAHLRPPIAAIYHFARTADDLADEGSASADERLSQLQHYRACLLNATTANQAPGNWPRVFAHLHHAIAQWQLPTEQLHALLDAFEQDIRVTASGVLYANDAAVLDYCSRSANPIGRLLLHLYGIHDKKSLAQSDAICTALQLINFWQDLSVDHARNRCYLSIERLQQHHMPTTLDALHTLKNHPNAINLIADLASWARSSMQFGQNLVHTIPGRLGWELRLVVQGGLAVLRQVEHLGPRVLQQRPVLRPLDWLAVAARSLQM
ncbi:squalene synthase HpnC [Curvibacter sp. CHRR-16]|uniref:squalene synthase HpnC n=1 Tax=Curvibacter sp. CHRR-16 TaxID=2835872 RepID=UPI001BD93D7F|nr:squalene synthase HpnC [Curvibacter sp. CHRR-16]MBT0569268.1 squalene synthase HpnC [Curvibacter sp. CHRR-16]